MITEIENSGEDTITVSCNNKHNNSYNAWAARIHWDSKSALLCDDTKESDFDFKNGTQVPALILGHEIAHVYHHMKNGYKEYIKQVIPLIHNMMTQRKNE